MKSTNVTATEENSGAKLSLRGRYQLEKQQIQSEIGDFDQILKTLGMSQRRVCQLLLVDPSAWTRWNKTGAPPHIFQALRWLIQLKKANPDAIRPTDLAARLDYVQSNTHAKMKSLEENIAALERTLTFTAVAMPERNYSGNETALLALEQKFMKVIEDLETKINQLTLKLKYRSKLRSKLKRPSKPRIKLKAKKSLSKGAKNKMKSGAIVRKRKIAKFKSAKKLAPRSRLKKKWNRTRKKRVKV